MRQDYQHMIQVRLVLRKSRDLRAASQSKIVHNLTLPSLLRTVTKEGVGWIEGIFDLCRPGAIRVLQNVGAVPNELRGS